MGTLTSVLGTALQFAQPLIGGSQKDRSGDLAYQQAKEDATLKKKQNLLNYQSAESDRQQRLRRTLFSQRAISGSRGVGDSGGSADAVLQGLTEASDLEGQKNKSSFDLTNESIDVNLDQQRRVNLLRKQQQRQNISLGYLTDTF